MNRLFLSRLLLFFLVLGLSWSCSVQKRHYSKGYSVSWKNRKHNAQPSLAATPETKSVTPSASITKAADPSSSVEENKVSVSATPPAEQKRVEASAKPTPAVKLYKDWQQDKKDKELTAGPEPGGKPKTSTSKNSSLAIVALIFAVLGISFLPVIGSIIGLILANAAIAKYKASPDKYGGEEIAIIARIISIIGLVIGLVLLLFAIWIIVGALMYL